jgi:hypothetical protein
MSFLSIVVLIVSTWLVRRHIASEARFLDQWTVCASLAVLVSSAGGECGVEIFHESISIG